MLFSSIEQNPASVCPPEITVTLEAVSVPYVDFEGRGRNSEIVVSRKLVPAVLMFFNNACTMGFPINEVAHASEYGWDDDALMTANVSSGFNYRTISGSDQLSAHAQGRAFDINPLQNPYIRYDEAGKIIKPEGAVWHPGRQGTLHKNHPLVRLMKNSGWTWGGDWQPARGRTDYQHFEKLS